MTKRCRKCDVEKPTSQFAKLLAVNKKTGRPRSPDGLHTRCRTCCREDRLQYADQIREANRRYHEEHRDEIRERKRRTHEADPTKRQRKWKRYADANRDRLRARGRAYLAANRERLNEQSRAYYHANKERQAQLWQEWRKKNRDKLHARDARRRARERGAAGNATTEEIAARVAFYGHACWVCGGPHEAIDHVIPLAKGGSHWPANLRPICNPCNRSKGGKTLDEWWRMAA